MTPAQASRINRAELVEAIAQLLVADLRHPASAPVKLVVKEEAEVVGNNKSPR